MTVMLRTQPANEPRPSYWCRRVSTSTKTSCATSSAAARRGDQAARERADRAFERRGRCVRSAASSPARARASDLGRQVGVVETTDIREVRCASPRKGRSDVRNASVGTVGVGGRHAGSRARAQPARSRTCCAAVNGRAASHWKIRRLGEPLAVRVIGEQQRAALQRVDHRSRDFLAHRRASPAATEASEPFGDGLR